MRTSIIFVLGLAMLTAPAFAQLAQPLRKKVLIIGVDGTRPDALAVARTPNLNALRTNGCFTDRAVTHPVTHSAACWSSMFTGVWGDKHGVNDPGNSFTGNRFDLYPNFMQRIEASNTNLSTVAYLRWAPLSTALAGTDLIQSFGSDDAITTATCQRLTNSNPDVFYTILLDVDSAGHSYGWGPLVTNYVLAIEAADARVGRIISALTNRPTYADEDWLVITLSDHGEHDSTVERSQLTFHIISGPSAGRGIIWPAPAIVDVCATVLTHMGVTINPAWNLDGRVEGQALPPPAYGTNLIFNGDAESNSGTNNYSPNRGIAWWWDYTSVTVGCYGVHTNFPGADAPGPTNRGRQFFLGGTNANTNISQIIDLSSLASDIDDPGVTFELSGWFGGATNQADRAMLTARFLNGARALLGTNAIGPVTAADRTNATGLLERRAAGTLPPGTRLIEFVLAFIAPSGNNDGSADNLSFVLTPTADSPPYILAHGFSNQVWRVEFDSRTNRLYALQRSTNLVGWTSLLPETPGTGARLELLDDAPPEGQGFYRVRCRKP